MITKEHLDTEILRVHNADAGYSLRPDHIEWKWFFYPQQIWRFEVNKAQPLMIELVNGVFVMPNYVFTTDLGSIPLPLRIIFPSDEFPPAYALHDDEYNRHGVFARGPGDKEFYFVSTDRRGADQRLYKNIMSICKGSAKRAFDIYLGVRLGGGHPWKNGTPSKGRRRAASC
jgi:hypothetical protein